MEELEHAHPHGVFLRREAIAAGYDDKVLYRLLRRGTLHRVRYGAYVRRATWDAASQVRRHALAAHAVSLTHDPVFGISHVSGAVLHGVDLWGASFDRVHLSRAEPMNGLRTRDVVYHLDDVSSVCKVEGTPVLQPASCVLGVARLSSVEAGVVAVDSALEKGIASREDLASTYERTKTWPGAARLQITMRLAEKGAQSVGESRARFLFFRHGLPKPVLQFAVYDGADLVGTADFAWPELGMLGEFDGKVKYGRLLRPGESPADAVYREKLREDRMREVTGWRMIRLSWADLADPTRTAARVRRALGLPTWPAT